MDKEDYKYLMHLKMIQQIYAYGSVNNDDNKVKIKTHSFDHHYQSLWDWICVKSSFFDKTDFLRFSNENVSTRNNIDKYQYWYC